MKRNLLKNMTAAIAALFIALLALPQTAQAQSKEAYVVENGSTLTFYYDTKKATRTGTVYGIDDMRTDDTKVPAWAGSRLDKNERTTKAVFDSSFKDYRPATTSCWFCICKTLATIEGIENLNTEEVTDMSNMFLGCSAMTSIDVTNFNTAKVTNMSGMFSACSALTTIYCNDNWKSDVVKESTGMFRGSSKLKGFANYDDTRTDVSMANPSSGYFTRKSVAYVVENGSTLTFYYDTKKATRTGTGITIYGIDEKRTDDTKVPAWAGSLDNKNKRTTKAVFDSSFKNYRPTTTASWFYFCTYLETIEGMENLNTEEVTDMSRMFEYCESLKALDVSKFNTAKVTNMNGMFCHCSSLKSLDVSKFNTANVTYMIYMFTGCIALTSLDISNFNTANVTDMSGMFYNCSALTTIYCNDDWTKGVVKQSEDMFYDCTKLKGAVPFDATKTDVTMANPTTGYFTKIGEITPVAYVVEYDGTLTFYYDTEKYTRIGYIYDINQKKDASVPIWAGKDIITKVVFDKLFKDYRPTTTASWFYSCKNLETVEGIEYLNTEEVTDMSRMFAGCNALTALDVSKFNTAKVTDMSYMFLECSSLTSLNVSSFNTAKVTNMSGMFAGSALTTLDLTSFNTANVTDMSEMFAFCDKLTSLDLSKFNTEKVTNMTSMFWACEALTTIYCDDDWTKGVVTESENMFADCTKLKGAVAYDANRTDVTMANPTTGYFTKKGEITPVAYVVENGSTLTFYYDTEKATRTGTGITIYGIDDKRTDDTKVPAWAGSKLDKNERTTKVVFDSSFKDYRPTTTSCWFCICKNLATIEGIENLNTEEVTDMSNMYMGCSALTSIDVTNFNTAKVTDMSGMFSACSALTTIYCYDNWNRGVVKESTGMFIGCTNLKGFATYDANRTDVSMANPSSGYFTRKPVAYVVENGSTLTFYYDAKKETRTGTGITIYGIDDKRTDDTDIPAWAGKYLKENERTTKAVFDSSFKNYRPTTTASWFENCTKLATIEGIENLNTEEVTDMSDMFLACESLTSLDVSKFNTAKVTDMFNMFFYCLSLTSLDVSKFNTANVTDMSYMFCYCTSLTALDLSSFNTANVTHMHSMFDGCKSLTSLDVSKFNTGNVTDMKWMFNNCSALTTIYCDDDWTKGVVTESENMFADCTKLKGAVAYDANRTDVTMANPTTGYFTKKGEITPVAYVVEYDGTLTFYYDTEKATRTGTGITIYGIDEKWTDNTDIPAWAGKSSNENVRTTKAVFDSSFKNYRPTTTASWFNCCKKLETIEGMENLNTEEVTDMGGMFEYCESLKALDVSKFNTAKVTNMWSMFDGCSSLTSLDVSKFNTANVTNMIYMFCGCSALTSLDVSNFNTGNVTNMYGMFYDCSSLTSLDVSKFNTANVTNMNSMFSGCSSLKSLNLSSLNTEKVTDMNEMFWGCESLTSLDVSNFNTANVTDMSGMFCCCSGLEALDVSNFNTAKVTNMNYMFLECSSLTSLNVSKLYTANVTDMSEMFSGCSSLKSLNLSSLNTANVTNMSEMFSGCKSLTSLDVSNFNTANVTYMMSMFWACEALTTIYCDDDWTKGVVTESENMFADCTKLKGAVTYDANRTDVTMANPTTGYFTRKNTTGIDAATVDTPAARRGIYTLNGVRLNTSPDNLPAGIYVIDGRKVVKR